MLKVRNYSITKKLTRMNMLVSGAALLTACAAFIAYDLFTFRASIVYNLSIQAQIIGSNSVSALAFNDPQSAGTTLSALKAAPNILSAGIYSVDGRPLATYGHNGEGQMPALPSIPRGQNETYWFKGGEVVVARSIVFQGKPAGTVYIRSDLRQLNARLRRYAIIAAVVLAASLLAALLVSRVIRKSTSEPIVHLAELARIVSRDKDYSVRATPTNNRDELSILIDAFNDMLSQIQESDADLQTAHAKLEQRVQERTVELTEANEHLRQEVTEREKTEESLRASEERFRSLAEAASDAILSADSEGNIIFFNRAAEQTFSYSVAEIIGRPLTVIMPARFHAAHLQGLNRFLRTGEARVIGKTVELAGRKKDGTEFPIELSLSSWKTNEGIFFTGILSDITERKQAEEALERHRIDLARSNVELAAANKELESFSYSVSHDLRAPLRSIDGFSQALLEDCADRLNDREKDHLNRVRRATQRMGILIDDLLNLSRVTRTEMHIKRFDISALACSLAADLQTAHPTRRVEFRIEHRLEAVADPGLLQNVLENLLGNAWKFTSKRASACIEFGQVHLNGTSAYFVRDNGAGFDQAYSQRLFGAFQRLHTGSEFPGSGVGLATVQRIIHRHGGRIWAESAVDKGATFYFTLAETHS
jgi:PAS domain S-box-containing protein